MARAPCLLIFAGWSHELRRHNSCFLAYVLQRKYVGRSLVFSWFIGIFRGVLDGTIRPNEGLNEAVHHLFFIGGLRVLYRGKCWYVS